MLEIISNREEDCRKYRWAGKVFTGTERILTIAPPKREFAS
jgi:hypothetical protein